MVYELLEKGIEKGSKTQYYKMVELFGLFLKMARSYFKSNSTNERELAEILTSEVGQKCNPEVLDYFTSTFFESTFGESGHQRLQYTPKCQDKLVCYTIVLYFHIQNAEVNLAPLAFAMGSTQSKLKKFVEETGAKVKTTTDKIHGQQFLADFTFPITFRKFARHVK